MFRETTRVFLYRILLAAIIFLSDVIIARTLGPTLKGYLYILIISPVLISSITGIGLDYALNHLGHKEPDKIFSIFTTAIVIGCFFSFIIGLPIAFNAGGVRDLIYKGISHNFANIVVLSLTLVPLEVTFILSGMFNMTTSMSVVFSQMRVVRRVVILIAAIIFLFLETTFVEKGIPFFIGAQIISIVIAVFFSLKQGKFKLAFPNYSTRSLVREGLKAYPGRVSEKLQTRVDVVLLGMFASGAAVGVYSVATGIAEMLFFVSGSLSAVLFSKNINDHEDAHQMAFRLMLPLATIMALMFGLAGTFLIPIFYGRNFSGSIQPLWYLLPGVIFFSLVQTITPYTVQKNLSRAVSLGQVVGVLSNVALNLFLIPRFHASGAALASSFSYGLTLFVMILYMKVSTKKKLSEFVFSGKDYIALKIYLRGINNAH